MFEAGETQYESFSESRFVTGELMVSDTAIKKNLFKLPSCASTLKVDSDQMKLSNAMITKLDSACLNRTDEGLALFATEFTGVPECFIKDGVPFNGTKADILKSIAPKDDRQSSNRVECSAETYIVDLSVNIRAKASVRDSLDTDTTYNQFCTFLVSGAINSAKSAGAKRLDLVADLYWPDSIKGPTKKKERNSFWGAFLWRRHPSQKNEARTVFD